MARILIVSYPKSWTPSDLFDVPPRGTILGTKSAKYKRARRYLKEFNRCEFERPTGVWSVLARAG